MRISLLVGLNKRKTTVLNTLFVLFFFLPVFLLAQKGDKMGSIDGRLIDSATVKPMGLATVAIFSSADTVLITYRMSNDAGNFQLPGLPLQKPLRVIISFSGYSVIRREIVLTDETPKLSLGVINMTADIHSLDEILVFSERPPVVVKKDTIEFNASSFKTLPTALVEDLLKKLPGVQLDADGNITVNGRKVNRIMVDGKDFFGGDTKLATKNLPANIIEKVQVTNDNDELEQNPDRAKASLGQVINLKLKKGVKKGWFGKAYAGIGTDDHYETGSIINLFRDTLQVSLLGFSNNLNKAGFAFTDVRKLAGFDRSGISSISTANGGLMLNGISFGGTGEGVQVAHGIGVNLNNISKKGLILNTQYFFGQTKNDIEEINNRQQFLGDTILTSISARDEVLKTFTHRLGLGFKFKIDSFTRVDFKPGLILTAQNSKRLTNISTTNNMDGLLNSSNNLQHIDADELGYNHTLSIFRNYRKKGRTLNLYQVLGNGYTQTDQFNSATDIIHPQDTTLLDQLRKRTYTNLSINNLITYIEPLSATIKLRVIYTFNYLGNRDDLATLNKDFSGPDFTILNSDLSNNINRKTFRNNLATAIAWSHKLLTITTILNLLKLDISNKTVKGNLPLRQHYNYILPGISIDWKEINLAYSILVTPPGITEVQTVPDNTNPLYIIKGNPNLKPAVSQNFYLNFYKNIQPKSLSLNAYLNGNISRNGIVRSREITVTGIQTAMPVNANNIQNFYTQFNINKQYRPKKGIQLSASIGYYINYYRTLLIINQRVGFLKTIDFSPYIRAGVNWKDKIEWNWNVNRGIYNTYYKNSIFSDLKTLRYGFGTDIVVRWPRKIVWESSLDYRYNSAVATGIQRNTALLNAGVTYLFLKGDKGQLKISVFDALNQNIAVTRITAENYINNRQINILKQYFLLTFTYNIRDFKVSKVGGKQSLFIF